MATFEIGGQLQVHSAPCESGNGHRLRTEGLAARRHPELEMVQIPEEQVKDAVAVLNAVAEYVGAQQVVHAGERIAIRGPRAAMVVGLQAAADPKAKKGLFGKLFGKTTLLRVSEPDEALEYPKTLLSTLKLWRAAALLAEEETDAAKKQLEASIAYFPGDATRRDAPQVGVPFNWENHLAYAMLAEVEPTEAGKWLEAAMERADTYELDRLGDHAEELRDESRELLLETVEVILDHNLHSFRSQDFAPGVRMLSSPIWLHVAENDGSSVAHRTVTVLPESFLAYYYEGDVAERLGQDGAIRELVVDALKAQLEAPAKLALLVQEIRQIYEGGQDEEMAEESTPDYLPGAQILSLLLADVGRRLYAGLTFEELRAGYGLVEDPAQLASGQRKMAELELKEADAYLATIQASDEADEPADDAEEPTEEG